MNLVRGKLGGLPQTILESGKGYGSKHFFNFNKAETFRKKLANNRLLRYSHKVKQTTKTNIQERG